MPRELLDRATFSTAGQYWVVAKDAFKSERAFSKADVAFKAEFFNQTKMLSNYDSVEFVALGFSGSWAFNVGGRTYYDGPASFKAVMVEAANNGVEVLVSSAKYT